ncbi:hypothetical protein CBR_g40553 [Chara braunii]|uniref:Uncharacterized protein n=1 Tax=Chara braunii TaxID=69332 RepID=A0A388K265_CHABU|nr:hypothetical protein CBR_g40553 [Chara braunii]|eukprot:GBG64105.1 hypothetical protein CBR_g40553 [Chara braunii]
MRNAAGRVPRCLVRCRTDALDSEKGPGGKRRAFGSHESRGTESHCERSRDSDMRDEAALMSYQMRVHSHLSARTLFHEADERKVLEGPVAGVLETRASKYERYASEGASIDFKSKSATDPGEEELSQDAHVVHREEETQHWPPCRVLDGLDAEVLETGASEHLCHRSEGERLQRMATSVQGPVVGVLEIEASECEGHALEETHVVQRDEELLQGSSGTTINIGDTDLVLHSGSPLTTQEGGVKGARLRGDEEGEEEPLVEARLHDDDEGEEPMGEAQLFGGEVLARLHDDEAGEETVGETQLYAGEVSTRQMGSERINHDSPSTRCGEEQGDRASVLSSGQEMVLHEATELVSDSTAIELISDSGWSRCRTLNPLRTLPKWRDRRPVSLEGLPSTVRFVNSGTRGSVAVQFCGHPD